MADGSLTPRAQARLDTIERIKEIAREHLAVDGAQLSLRAVARDLGVVSSAVYRYFPNRDELLGALVLDASAALAEAVAAGDAAVPRRDLPGRWQAIGRAAREWALENPNEFGLLYGNPVPGYERPADAAEPVAGALAVAVGVLRDGVERGAIDPPSDRLPRAVRADLDAIRAMAGFEDVPAVLLARGLSMWTLLVGAIAFEVFGATGATIADPDAWFDSQLRMTTRYLGLSR